VGTVIALADSEISAAIPRAARLSVRRRAVEAVVEYPLAQVVAKRFLGVMAGFLWCEASGRRERVT
jgi:hypothetical protein